MLRETSIDEMPHGCKTHEEALLWLWKLCGGRDMVPLTTLCPGELDTPYANCRKEVAYVRRLHSIVHAFEDKHLDNGLRSLLLQCGLLGRTLYNVHLLRRRGMFDHGNKFFLCVLLKERHVRNVAVHFPLLRHVLRLEFVPTQKVYYPHIAPGIRCGCGAFYFHRYHLLLQRSSAHTPVD